MVGGPLLAILVLLTVTVALVPLFKVAGLGTVLGYLAAGVVIGPYGLRLVTDVETIRSISEFGVVIMLFLIGLEVSPRDLWRLRHKVIGLGVTQMLGTAVLIAAALYAFGFHPSTATIAGLALAMSSTAIAMQTVQQRSITQTDTGRATLVTLLVQDMAVIPVLAAIPVLATLRSANPDRLGDDLSKAAEAVTNPYGWWIALVILGAFGAAFLASRVLVNPLMRWIASSRIPEGFTALALLLVVGAALGTEAIGLSPALGAFLAGVLLADSEYRTELEGNLEPFKGLLLGLFFISVGMGIAFSVLFAEPLQVVGFVAGLLLIKIVVLYVLATLWRMHVADRLLLSALLSQAGEFAFVVLGFAASAQVLTADDEQFFVVVVALSMAATPFLLLLFDRLAMPRFSGSAEVTEVPDGLPSGRSVIVLGYGRFGQIVTRMLRTQGYSMTLIDDDPAQIELVKRFGVKVFYGDGGRLDILRAAGVAEAALVVVAVGGGERILTIAELLRRNFPKVKIAARAIDRGHAHELMALGVEIFERETFLAAIGLGTKALVALGSTTEEAERIAAAFIEHDDHLLHDSYALRGDRDAYIGFVRRSTELLDQVMQADRDSDETARQKSG